MKRLNYILIAGLFLFSMGCQKGETIVVSMDDVNVAEEADIEDAKEKLKAHCASYPFSFGILEDDLIFEYDVTGDGNLDLCTDVYFGSGMPRSDVVVYDVVNDKYYSWDGMDIHNRYGYDYYVMGIEEDLLIVIEKSGEKKGPTFGEISIENGNKLFIPFDKGSDEYKLAFNKYYLARFERSEKVNMDHCAVFKVGMVNPVCFSIEDDYVIYGMFDDGYVCEITRLTKDSNSEYYFCEGKNTFFQKVSGDDYLSEICFTITTSYTAKQKYEIRYFDEGSKLYINGEEQDIEPEEYEEYCPLDDTYISITEIIK